MPANGYRVDEAAAQEVAAAQRRPTGLWIAALAVLVLLTEQTALGFQLIAPALGQFAAKYQTTQIIWIITVFTLVGGVLTPIAGKLGDRFGKRRVLLILAAVTVIGSIVCSLAPNFGILLVGRALMAASIAFLPVIYSLIRDVFPERMRDLGISIATNGVGVVTIAGPFLAGYMIDHVSPESVFWFVGVISAVGGIGAALLVPESPIRTRSHIDIPGAILLVAGLLLVLLGLSEGQTWGWGDGRTLGCLIGGAVTLAAWVVWERRTDEPLIDMQVLASRRVASVMFAYGFGAAAITVMASYLPMMLRTPAVLGHGYGFGISATEVAVYLLPAGILTVASGFIVGLGAKRHGFRVYLILGALLCGIAGLLIGTFHTQPWMPIVFYSIVGLGAMLFAAGPNLILAVAPADQRGIAAGMLGTSASVIGAVATGIAGAVLAANVGHVIQGVPIYTDHGMSVVFYIAGGVGLLGGAIGLAVPAVRRRVAHAEDSTATVAAERDTVTVAT
jgi:MFS family permease